MPHLTLPIGAGGPILELFIGVSSPRADALKAAGQRVPPQVKVRALLDTGASCTGIDSAVLAALGVVSTGTTPLHTPSTTSGTPHVANQYDVSITLVHPLITRTFRAMPVIESHLAHQGIQALIGRDVLSLCLLTYDGVGQTFSLCF
jgi:hypothetical protein